MAQKLSTQHLVLNTVNLSKELTFLINCCKTDPSEDDINFIFSYINAEHLKLNALINLASQHGVLPLLHKTIKNLSENDNLNAQQLTLLELNSDTSVIEMKEGCKAEILSELKAHYLSISQRNMLMSAELIQIIKLLKVNGIEALAFKGPTLSQTAYGDITLRQFGDLDILIKRSDIYPMIDLLTDNGYTLTIDLDTSMKDIFIHALNVIGFYKSATNCLIEVHWELLSKNYAITWDENLLWAQKENVVNINGTDIPTLPFEQQLLYICVHSAKHLFERLEWICDIDRSIRVGPSIDWSYLINEAEKIGVQRMLYLGLVLCQYFFRLELPELIQENIKKDKVLPKLISKIIKTNFSEPVQTGKNYRSFGLLWDMRENLSDKLRFTWHAFFAPQFDDFKFIQLPSYLAFLYPVVRQFRLVKKYIQR